MTFSAVVGKRLLTGDFGGMYNTLVGFAGGIAGRGFYVLLDHGHSVAGRRRITEQERQIPHKPTSRQNNPALSSYKTEQLKAKMALLNAM
jgi:hypothetical protein